MVQLDTPIQFVRGIGPQIAATLAEKGIVTVEDLLFHLPFRYEDRAHPRAFSDLKAGEMAAVIAEVRGTATLKTRNMPIFEMTVGQNLETLKCMWFRGTYLEGRFKPGQMLALYGKVEGSRSTKGFKMIQPQIEVLPDNPEDGAHMLEVGRIVPVYESLGGSRFSSRWIRRVQHNLLEELRGRIPETLPPAMVERLGLPSREESLRLAHFPPVGTPMTALQAFATPAFRRLIFEELFYLEFGLELKRRKLKERAGVTFETGENVREALRQVLPFHPTGAQKRALGEIVGDMRQSSPMRRLLQGDVGAGKTIVALQAMLVAIENGYQAALMAPTEILATQHSLGIRKLLEKSGRKYKVTLLTGSLDEDRKKLARRQIYNGTAQLVIGTHALIEEKVEFAKLGLVVVDEQHRFGVLQRFRMMKKPGDADPDVLVMTATPIPRTLALSLYGDLDVSVLDELPPGRTPIVTKHVQDEREDEVWKLLRQQIERGHQAYIVYPVIEGSKDDQPELDFAPPEPEEPAKPEKGKAAKGKKKAKGKAADKDKELFEKPTLKSATEMYERLRTTHLSGLKLGLLHGRLDADEKDVIMRRFQRGDIDVLVSTTVIEVGVDVPNASVMVIEHAERFGLAQLHQLRGRVGRGAAKSYCILMTSGRVSPGGEERIAAMVRTQNGFELAEIDLEQRGPGEVFGTKQAGLPDFRVANIVRDRGLLELAKGEAAGFVENKHGETSDEAKRMVWTQLRGPWQRRYGLVEVG
ncbi:ATP-dependent DNA helicase RecG [Silvibacterium sp.]|uniref:ATP-dependent DNA helicase RecG n=1 Tax=Silvibacterium sp. TaxID=1964179 RepID=UPI0039E31B26